VAAHLTLAQTGLLPTLGGSVRARGSFNRMIHDTAVREARLPVREYPIRLRAMVGSRRAAPMVSDLEPPRDQLVHGHDTVVAPGSRPGDAEGSRGGAATRAWTMGFPFHARKRLGPVCLTVPDHPWTIGEGPSSKGRSAHT
jgi:hypothetical protein